MPELSLPFTGAYPVTQPFGAVAPMEPAGYRAGDGSINYSGDGTPGHFHNGVDYGLPCGTPLQAAADGLVVASGTSPSGFGLRVMIRDSAGHVVLTGHMSSLAVQQGQTVKAGQRIGLSGSTGNSTGCHVHVSVIRPDGSYIDPAPYLSGPPAPPPPTKAPADRSGIVFLPESFYARTKPGSTRAWDGPSDRLHTLAVLPAGTIIQFDAWQHGEAKWDDDAHQWDARWYHRVSGGWIASSRVIGNAPDSQP